MFVYPYTPTTGEATLVPFRGMDAVKRDFEYEGSLDFAHWAETIERRLTHQPVKLLQLYAVLRVRPCVRLSFVLFNS